MTAVGGSARQGQRQSRKSQEPLASQWWSQRFTALLEGYGLGPRMERGSNSMAIRGCCWPGTAAIAKRCCRRCNRGLRGWRPAAAKLATKLAASSCGARGLLARAPALGKRVLMAPKLAAMKP